MKVKKVLVGKYIIIFPAHPPPSMYYVAPLSLKACLRACEDGLQVIVPQQGPTQRPPPVSLTAGHLVSGIS